MPTVSPTLLPVLMLFASNVFMTFAWYGHLKFKESALPTVVLASWGINVSSNIKTGSSVGETVGIDVLLQNGARQSSSNASRTSLDII